MFTSEERTVADRVPAYAASQIALRLRDAITERGHASLVLAGGSTYRDVYRELAREEVDWLSVDLFFGDERQVPLDDDVSNCRMAREALGAAWDMAHVHPLEDSSRYEQDISQYIDGNGIFDIVLLGVGSDGHTASLFPGQRRLWSGTDSLVLDTPAEQIPLVDRRTLTPPALSQNRFLMVVATGEGKAAIVRDIISEEEPYPVLEISTQGEKLLVLDTQSSHLIRT